METEPSLFWAPAASGAGAVSEPPERITLG
jgi:hypothetical protein